MFILYYIVLLYYYCFMTELGLMMTNQANFMKRQVISLLAALL